MPGKFKIGIKLFLLLVTCYLLVLLTSNYQASTIYAQSACQDTLNPRVGWLVSAKSISGKFKSLINPCTLDPSGAASFGTGFIDTYLALKTKFFTNPGSGQTVAAPFSGVATISSTQTRYNITGNATITAISGTTPALVFVDGNLIINGNLSYSGDSKGVVFIVNGNVIISASTVTTIDAFIIAAGANSIVCTGSTDIANTTSCPAANSVTANQLAVNGSLISLSTASTPIYFNRTLGAPNSNPAEKFNFQPKYYVLFRDLFSDSMQTWKEVAGLASNFTPTYSQSSYAYSQSTYYSQASYVQPPQTPVQTGISGTKTGPIAWDSYSVGFRFTPTINGQITRFWSYATSGTIRMVKLYTDSGILITSASITNNGSWASSVITPVNVIAGTSYRIVVFPASGAYYINPITPTLPATIGNITINNGIYLLGDGAVPSNDETTLLRGLVDITFQP